MAIVFIVRKFKVFNTYKLREVIRIPLSHSHGKRVDVLIKLVEQCDALDYHIVRSVDVELDLAAGVGVAETELRLRGGLTAQAFDQLVEMEPDATDDFGHYSDVADLDPKCFGNSASEFWIEYSKNNLLQLFR